MRKLMSITAVLCLHILANAQEQKKYELFGGYSYERVDSGIVSADLLSTGVTQTTLDNPLNLNGFNVSGTGYLTKRFGLTADFSAHFNNREDLFDSAIARSKFKLFNVSGGPQFSFPNETRFTPFARALAGISHRTLSEDFSTSGTSVLGSDPFRDSSTSFMLNFGGGLDYRINKRFAYRIVQFDYNPIFLRSRVVNALPLPDSTLNGFRFSTGLVFK